MEKITSFTINHLELLPGIYVSRKDKAGDSMITTFDIRMTRPNFEPVMNTAEIHTIEHLAATFLRNHGGIKDRVIYFGPMGCRTGFYLLLAGDYQSRDIVPLMKEMFVFIRDFEGDVPGASARDCGNYLDMNLPMAKWLADRFLREVTRSTCSFVMPQPSSAMMTVSLSRFGCTSTVICIRDAPARVEFSATSRIFKEISGIIG